MVVVRNLCYDRGVLKSFDAAAVVISVGNITTGGTGKTPLVIWLCKMLKEKSVSCAILTRGYKAGKKKLSDEPAILAKACPGAKVVINADRVSGAEKAVRDYHVDVLVMDDGFQHRRLRRNLDIVAIDATCPFGYGRSLPAGLLREPVRAIRRADLVVITRYDLAGEEDIAKLEDKIKKIAPDVASARAKHRHPYAKAMKGEMFDIEQLRERTIFAFCGIGNPGAFLNNLKNYGLNISGSKVYNDHHCYTAGDVTDIYEEARYLGADMILSTEKDWVKTTLLWKPEDDIVLAYLALELEFVRGADIIEALVDGVVSRKGCDV